MANLTTSRGPRHDAEQPFHGDPGAKSSNHDTDLHHLEMKMQTDVQALQDAGGTDAQIRMENAWLRRRVVELEQQLVGASADNSWSERQKEYEALLEEKSEVIRMLHHKIHEMQENNSPAPVPQQPKNPKAPPDEGELVGLKQQLEDERSQLREDEESLMTQMRQMELTMSKERAELARQRTEMQRMHEELNREIEMAARDGSLRDRLQALQRRQQEVIRKPGPVHSAPPQHKPVSPPPDQPTPLPGERKKSSGFLRRLFG